MDDEAYYSGNLQTETGSAEKAEPSPEDPKRAKFVEPERLEDPSKTPTTESDTFKGKRSEQGYSLAEPQPQTSRRKKTATTKFTHSQAVTPKYVISPTSNLTNRMDLINITFGKRTVEESDSPTSDYGSGNFPSLPSLTDSDRQSVEMEKGAAMRHPQASLENDTVEKDFPIGRKLETGEASSVQVVPQSSRFRDRSESPCVPPVGEDIEVMTETPMERELMRPAGSTSKRTFASQDSTASKTPRLSGAGSQKAIRVSTIVSPSESWLISLRQKPERGPEKAKSPVTITVDNGGTQECEVTRERVRQSSPHTRSARVNFDSITELSKSDRPLISAAERMEAQSYGEEVERDTAVRSPQNLSTYSHTPARFSDSTSFTERRSPQPAESPMPRGTSPMAVENLIGPRSQGRRSGHRSPHSPRSPQREKTSDKDISESYHSTKTGKDPKEKKPHSQSALLQVSEAHLAILPDEDGDTPLHLAIIHENFPLTQYLIRLIVGVYMNLDIANNMRQTPLHLAVITRQPHMVQLLVGAGASVNFPDRKGNTSIHLAAQRRDVRILKLLSQATSPLPDFNTRNFAGLTSVHVATREASIDVLKFLFQMGANKNATDACSGRSPLHYAVEAENFILTNFLLENGLNVNAATFSGNTPLHIAAGRRLKEIVALLMAYGANPAIANGEGDFPTDLPASLLMQRAKMNAH